jgi:transposase
MEVIFEVSAGLDVHRDTVVASVRKRGAKRDEVETKTFGTFQDELRDLCTWLDGHDVKVIAMESTGVYFKPVLRAVREQLPNRLAWLVNAAAVKQVPGRKTDVNDSAWLSKLAMHGLVRPSFVPKEAQEDLRILTRYRCKRVGELRSTKNRIIKLLEAYGLKLATLCSDVLGKSGRDMIEAVIVGTQSPEQMANLARGSLRTKRAELARALAARPTEGARWVLRRLMDQLVQIEGGIQELDDEIARRLAPFQKDIELLLQVPGLDHVSIAAVLAETGADMSIFNSAKSLASWGGLAPGSYESAGKTRDTPTRKGNRWLRTILVQVAQVAVRAKDSPWRSSFARMARGTGSIKKAIFGVARKVCVTIFHVLCDRIYRPYAPPPPTPEAQDRTKRLAIERLTALGYNVSLSPAALAGA